MPKTCRLVLFCVVLTLLPFGLGGVAQAHAVLRSALPADGSLLPEAPPEAILSFNEPVQPISIRLLAPDGSETDLTDSVQGAAEVRVPLPSLARGTHVLSWRVVSEDGHPVPGALMFSVMEVTGTAPLGQERAPGVTLALWLARALMTIGLVIGVGGAVFARVAPPDRAGVSVVRGFVLLGAGSGLAHLGLHGLDALGLGLSALRTAAPWSAAAGTTIGPSAALAGAAAVAALISLRWSWVCLVALALLGAAYATSGHAASAQPQWVTRPLVALHLVALTLWAGALIPLGMALRRTGAPLGAFSAMIPYILLMLLGSGLGLAVIQLGMEPAVWATPYGLVLGAKLGLLGLAFGLAAINRWRLTAPALAGQSKARQQMRRIIAAEVLILGLILALTAAWRFTPPPRALAQAAAAAPTLVHLHGDGAMALLTLTPGPGGAMTAEIALTDATLAPLAAEAITLGLALPHKGMERLTRSAAPKAGVTGLWHIPALVIPQAGVWSIDLEIRLTRFRLLKLAGQITLQP
jgi:copper transport protein